MSKIIVKVIFGSAIASSLVWSINPDLLGTSAVFWSHFFDSDMSNFYGRLPQSLPLVFVLMILIFIKMTGNCLTVGSGMSAGFASPVILIGMMIGLIFAQVFGISPGTQDYAAFLVAGFAGMLASSINIPIAAGVMCIEIFGLNFAFPAGFSAIIGFQVNRHDTIYDYTLDVLE